MSTLRSILKIGTSGAFITDEYGSESGIFLELMLGTAAVLEFDLRNESEHETSILPSVAIDTIAAPAYYFALDTVSSNSSSPALLRLTGINAVAKADGGTLLQVELPAAATNVFADMLSNTPTLECRAELGGVNADGETVFAWQFPLIVRNRVYLGGGEEKISADPDYYTALQVEAAIARELICEYSSGDGSWHTGQQSRDQYFRLRHGANGTPSDALLIPAGQTGPAGAQGEKGDKGDPGAQGEKGDKGDTGAQGEKGDKGDKGDPGAQGEKGDKGDTGAQGEKGDKGDKGDPGAQGESGDPGPAGSDGLTPHIGENGNWFIGETDTGVAAEAKHNSADFVVETWLSSDGDQWYRKYNSGWVEQGGKLAAQSSNEEISLLFPVPFAKVNYSIFLNAQITDTSTVARAFSFYNLSTTRATFRAATTEKQWFACGFAAH